MLVVALVQPLRQRLPDYKPDRFILDSVHIVDVKTGTVIENRQLVISDQKIDAINPAGTKPLRGFTVIDGQNAFVSPGLIDMHTHIYDRSDLVHSVRYGVTTVRNLRGFPLHLRIKAEQQKEQWLGSRLISSSPVLDNAQGDLFQLPLRSDKEARAAVRRYYKDGFDSIKVYNQLPKSILIAIVDEARKLNIPIVKHGPFAHLDEPDLGLALLEAVQSVEHAEEVLQSIANFDSSSDRIPHTLSLLAKKKIYFTPTLATYEHLTRLSVLKHKAYDERELEQINPFFRQLLRIFAVQRWLNSSDEVAQWNQKTLKNLTSITLEAHRRGVPLLVGSDQGTMYMTAGRSTHRELALMQGAGIPAAEVLKAATYNAAHALSLDSQLGSIAQGKAADLILTEKNPLEDVAHLSAPISIVANGRFLDRSRLKQMSETRTVGFLVGFYYLAEEILSR